MAQTDLDGALETIIDLDERSRWLAGSLPELSGNTIKTSKLESSMGKRLVFMLAALLYLMGAAYAGELSEAQVRGFIASLPQVNALGDKYDDGKRRQIDRRKPMSSAVRQMSGHEVRPELESLIKGHGFASLEQWGGRGGSGRAGVSRACESAAAGR